MTQCVLAFMDSTEEEHHRGNQFARITFELDNQIRGSSHSIIIGEAKRKA